MRIHVRGHKVWDHHSDEAGAGVFLRSYPQRRLRVVRAYGCPECRDRGGVRP